MHSNAAPRREVVLVGAGHAHVQILRGHQMRPLPADVRLTLVVDRPVAIYSGMVPGLVAGQYPLHAVEIDAWALGRRVGARVIGARATRIDAVSQQIHLEGRPPLRYDLASLNIGSTVAGLDTPGVREHAVATRPIAALIDALEARLASSSSSALPTRVVVVGGGAGGVELAGCIQARLLRERPATAVQVTLVSASPRLLPARAPRIGARVQRALEARGVVVRLGVRVQAVQADAVRLDDPQSPALPSDLTLWAVGAAPYPLARVSGLPVDARGFVQVQDTLQVEGHPTLLAAGDCAVPASWPEIPKAGVYAVRQGPVLMHNLRALLAGSPPKPYRAQRDFLTLLNLGDGTAVGARWGHALHSTAMMRLKDRIDRQFMARFQVLAADGTRAAAYSTGMPPMPGELEMVCGGCAAKVGQTPLERALERLPPLPAGAADGVVLGLQARDDVFAWQVPPAQTPEAEGADASAPLVVCNLDAFTAFVDDPWLVGRVGALNAMSDLLAKGVTPRYAAALVTLPRDEAPEEALVQVLHGIRSALDEVGAVLLGGHTGVGEQLSVGLHVTGLAESLAALWRLDGLRAGDAVVLTRALGTGVLWNADMTGDARGEDIQATIARMVRGNRIASAVAQRHPVHAATDVTGFGLAGHLGELCRASGVSARLSLAGLPALPGALALLRGGRRSTAHPENRRALRAMMVPADLGSDPRLELLFDPQTAGGLLLALPQAEAAALVADLHAAGEVDAVVVAVAMDVREDGALIGVEAGAEP